MDLTMKEANRYWVIFEVIKGHLKVKDAAETLNLSDRQIYRIKARVKEEGIEGVVHKTKAGLAWCVVMSKATVEVWEYKLIPHDAIHPRTSFRGIVSNAVSI